MCHAWRSCERAVCCSCASLGAAVGGALFGAWCKWGGGKEGALSVFKDTNGSGERERGSCGAGARGQRYGERRRPWRRHRDGGGGAAIGARQKAKKTGEGERVHRGGCLLEVVSAEGGAARRTGGSPQPLYI